MLLLFQSRPWLLQTPLLRTTSKIEMADSNIIIVGAGPSGIAFAHTLKHKLGFKDFTVSRNVDGVSLGPRQTSARAT